TTGWFQICDVRCPFEDFDNIEEIEGHSTFMSNRRTFMSNRRLMRRSIGGDAGGRYHGGGVLQRFAGDRISNHLAEWQRRPHTVVPMRCTRRTLGHMAAGQPALKI